MNNIDDDDFDSDFIDEEMVKELQSSIEPKGGRHKMVEDIEDDILDFDEPPKPKPVNKPKPKKVELDEDEFDFESDTYEDDEDNNAAWDPDAKKDSKLPKAVKVKLIVLGVVVLIGIILIMVFNVSNNSEELDVLPHVSSNIVAKEPIPKPAEVKEPQTEDGRIYIDYAELSDKFYKDTVVVSKYAKVDRNTCTYYFTGIPSNFKKEVSFVVDVDTFNSVANGSKVNVKYKIYKVNGVDYITGVAVEIEKG